MFRYLDLVPVWVCDKVRPDPREGPWNALRGTIADRAILLLYRSCRARTEACRGGDAGRVDVGCCTFAPSPAAFLDRRRQRSGPEEKLRERFGLTRVVLVGDRGILTQTQIDALRAYPGLGWVSALRFAAIRDLAERGAFQPSLFDVQNLAEFRSQDYPGERLVACCNPLMAEDRKRTREELLIATEARLEQVAVEVARRTRKTMTAARIGVKVGKIINRHKVCKHFTLTIEDTCSRECIARGRK